MSFSNTCEVANVRQDAKVFVTVLLTREPNDLSAWIRSYDRERLRVRRDLSQAIQDAYATEMTSHPSDGGALQDVEDLPTTELPEHSTLLTESKRQHYDSCGDCRQKLRNEVCELLRSSLKRSEFPNMRKLYEELFASMLDEFREAHPDGI